MGASLRAFAAAVAAAGLLLAPITSVRADTPETPLSAAPPAQGSPEAPASVIKLGFNETDRMTVPIHIAGLGPYAFIVDTAATGTVISRELASALKLKPVGRVRMLSLTGLNEVMQVHVPGLTFGAGEARDVRAFTLSEADMGGPGILGIDALRNQRVLLDFKARTLAVTKAPRRWSDEGDPNAIVVIARRKLGQLILADSTVDGEKIDVIVDTGAQVSLGNDALRRRLMRQGSRYKITPISLISVTGGILNADYTRVDQLRIGRAALIGMPIAFADAYPFRRLKLRKPALLLGMDALRMFARVTVDFANRRASFVLPEEVAQGPDATTGAAPARGVARQLAGRPTFAGNDPALLPRGRVVAGTANEGEPFGAAAVSE